MLMICFLRIQMVNDSIFCFFRNGVVNMNNRVCDKGISSSKYTFKFLNKIETFEQEAELFGLIAGICFIMLYFLFLCLSFIIDKHLNIGLIKLSLIVMFLSFVINEILSFPTVSAKHLVSSLKRMTHIHRKIIRRKSILSKISICFFISSLAIASFV